MERTRKPRTRPAKKRARRKTPPGSPKLTPAANPQQMNPELLPEAAGLEKDRNQENEEGKVTNDNATKNAA
jgi:hypothetical protein